MAELRREPEPATRVTCAIHHRLASCVREVLNGYRVQPALVESGRNVRQMVRRRPFVLPGSSVRLEDSPVDVFSFTVHTEDAALVMRTIMDVAELSTPGRGSLYAQRVRHWGPVTVAPLSRPSAPPPETGDGFLSDLALITAILSPEGGGEQLSGLALELGTCVPVVTRASGTGTRDRLGLLRVTIPAEKEVVSFLVPSYDTEGILRLLIEEMRLDRPGRGFIYQTPVHAARIDTRLRIGRQQHAASIEQIIAAIDDVTRGTAWRKRFSAIEQDQGPSTALMRDRSEVTVVCTEGNTRALLDAALAAGGGGATTSRARNLHAADDASTASAAAEKSVIHLPSERVHAVTSALFGIFEQTCDECGWIQVADSPLAYAYRPQASSRA